MGKILLLLLVALVVIAVGAWIVHALRQRARDKEIVRYARTAPELLRVCTKVDPELADLFVHEKEENARLQGALDDIAPHIESVLNLPTAALLGEHFEPMKTWLDNRKEIRK